MIRSFVLACLVGVSGLLWADQPVVLPECEAPVRPDKQDVERWNAFVDGVDAYRACINAFRARNYAEADAHRAAADAAVQAWNTFVRENLNVPEDFPHELTAPKAAPADDR